MTSRTSQRDLLSDLKNEICLNIAILGKLQPMSVELSTMMLKENAMEKPTQHLFIHLSHYLVTIVDSQASASLPWPLYDTQTERSYRSGLFNFISDYSNKGLLSPVMSSYLVNPGCYKVIMLVYQMTTLAIKKLLLSKMTTERHKVLYKSITEKYKSNKTIDLMVEIEKETHYLLCKFSKYLRKYKIMVKIAEILRNKIVRMDEKLASCNVENYIEELVEKFIEQQLLDDATKTEVRKIKNVSEPCRLFQTWLTDVDTQLDEMECKWNKNIEPFLKLCHNTQQSTQELINRNTGEMDKSLYMIEYNPKTDEIFTQDLQNHVNIEQKYVLKNIIKDGKLSFPYLIRGFLVAICFILKNTEIDDEIHTFNEYLDSGKSNYYELVSSMRILLDQVTNAEAKLQPSPTEFNKHYKSRKHQALPCMPDLSDLKSNRILHNQLIFDSFTPLNTLKHQFNLLRKRNNSFIRSQPMFATPFHHILREDFSKSILSCRMSLHNQHNISQNFHNMSMVPQSNRANETIFDCATGFTKQQIQRLLSTKKSSSSKKFKYKTQRPDANIKKDLFNSSNASNESIVLFRSHSSPNLFENQKRHFTHLEKRKLSVMQEDFASLLEVSGIVALSTDSCETPTSLGNTAKIDATSLPLITISPEPNRNSLMNMENDINGDGVIPEKKLLNINEAKTETPKNNTQSNKNTSSLEKIINRFKKVRANVVSSNERSRNEFKTIIEEKENIKTDNGDVFTVNRILLPDLLSPSENRLCLGSNEYLNQFGNDLEDKVWKKPRESLGTALGVDHTFLDQFDLVD